ncbi:hypothetical protein [Kineococcus sp. SYSU DK005]|uniref:hypothetical protein n=1 Tax=Kineococcus sp. SYSU DK005 TaxID=3383126 RepID=UPI003D7C52F1
MEVIDALGPALVAVVVVVLPLLVAAVRRGWSRAAVGLYLLSVVLLGVWTAKSVVIADSSLKDPPAWPAPVWMLAAVLATGASTAALLTARTRRCRSTPCAPRSSGHRER